jgi:hypothetical protein
MNDPAVLPINSRDRAADGMSSPLGASLGFEPGMSGLVSWYAVSLQTYEVQRSNLSGFPVLSTTPNLRRRSELR